MSYIITEFILFFKKLFYNMQNDENDSTQNAHIKQKRISQQRLIRFYLIYYLIIL